MKKIIIFIMIIFISSLIYSETKKQAFILPFLFDDSISKSERKKIENTMNSKLKNISFLKFEENNDVRNLFNKEELISLENIYARQPKKKLLKQKMSKIPFEYVFFIKVKKEDKSDVYNDSYLKLEFYSIKVHIYSNRFDQYNYSSLFSGMSIDDTVSKAVNEINFQKQKILYNKYDDCFYVTKEEENKIINKVSKYKKICIITKKNNKDNKAPNTVFKDPVSDKKYTINNLAGKIVILGIFEADYQFIWEFTLLERIYKMFPKNTEVFLGIINPTPEYIKSLKKKYKPDFPIVDITEFHNNTNIQVKKITNRNYIITDDGYITDNFNENFPIDFTPYSTRQKIERDYIRPYLKDNLNVKTEDFPYTITEACERNNLDLLKDLLKKGTKEINDYEGEYNPLIYAINYNNFDMVKTLIDHGADINAIKKYNRLSLKKACEMNNMELLVFLFKKLEDDKFWSKICKDLIYRTFKYYYSGYYYSKLDNCDILKLLISQVKIPYDINVLFFSLIEGEKTLFDMFNVNEIESILINLIDKGLDLFILNEEGQPPYAMTKSKNLSKTTAYIEEKLKKMEKEYGNLIIFAKEKLTYKEILAQGIKPKLKPDYKFPCYQQGKYDCFGFVVKHIAEYKYGETIDVSSFNKKYGEAWISYNQDKFAEMNGYIWGGISYDNEFFHLLAIGEPVIINYRFYYKDGSSIMHYAVAYSFDEQGIWLADSAGAKRWRMTYKKFYSEDGVGKYAWGTILNKINK